MQTLPPAILRTKNIDNEAEDVVEYKDNNDDEDHFSLSIGLVKTHLHGRLQAN